MTGAYGPALRRSSPGGHPPASVRAALDERRVVLAIEPLAVLEHHAFGGEALLGHGDAGLHHVQPAPAISPGRQHLALDHLVKGGGVARLVAGIRAPDRPTV